MSLRINYYLSPLSTSSPWGNHKIKHQPQIVLLLRSTRRPSTPVHSLASPLS